MVRNDDDGKQDEENGVEDGVEDDDAGGDANDDFFLLNNGRSVRHQSLALHQSLAAPSERVPAAMASIASLAIFTRAGFGIPRWVKEKSV